MKKTLIIILSTFLIINLWLIYKDYSDYVANAPVELKEARKDFHKAIIFKYYYNFFVKYLRVDYKSESLSFLKKPIDHYYNKGLNKLPKDHVERVTWFTIFEIIPYSLTVKGSYGWMTKKYGENFTNEMSNKIYKNIRILTNSNLKNDAFFNNMTHLENFINLYSIYTSEVLRTKTGHAFTGKKFRVLSNWHNVHAVLLDLFKRKTIFIKKYQKRFPKKYAYIMNENNSFLTPYGQMIKSEFMNSLFILGYKIGQNKLHCIDDKKYIDNINNNIKKISGMLKNYQIYQDMYKKRYEIVDSNYSCKNYKKESINGYDVYSAENEISYLHGEENLEGNYYVISKYRLLIPIRSIALAIEDGKVTTLSSIQNQSTQKEADDYVIKDCEERRKKNGMKNPCILYKEYKKVRIDKKIIKRQSKQQTTKSEI